MKDYKKSMLERRNFVNVIFFICCWLSVLINMFVLFSVMYSLLKRGLHGINLHIFFHDTRELGLRNAISGSLILTFASVVISTPISVLTATFFVEYQEFQLSIKILRFVNDVLLSTPSVIVGLFVYTLLVLNTTFSGFAGILALSVVAIPMITRSAEDILRMVPTVLKESVIALGVPKWRSITMVSYRSVKTGLVTAVFLATARIMGESAPLLFTSAKNNFLSFNLNNAIETLPVTIFENAMQPYQELQRLAWSAALLITFSVLAINISARFVFRDRDH